MKAWMYRIFFGYNPARFINGEVPEWLNGIVSKTIVGSGPPGVRIPPSPLKPDLIQVGFFISTVRPHGEDDIRIPPSPLKPDLIQVGFFYLMVRFAQ